MQKLTDRHGLPTYERVLRFTFIRVGSRPESKPLADALMATRKEVAGARERHELARELRVAATAEIEYLDGERDQVVLSLQREVLVLTKGRRDDPRYLKMFPESTSTLLSGVSGDKQERFVRTVTGMVREDPMFAPLAHYAVTLTDLNDRLEAALKAREELYQPEARAEADLRVALDKARRQYNLAHAQLQVLFPDRPALVESCFLRILPGRAAGGEHVALPEAGGEIVEGDTVSSVSSVGGEGVDG